MAKATAPKISPENPLRRALKLGEILLHGKPHKVCGIVNNPQALMVRLKDLSERAFRASKADVIKALRLLDEQIATKDAQRDARHAKLTKAASLVHRHRLPPSRIYAAPASARSQARNFEYKR